MNYTKLFFNGYLKKGILNQLTIDRNDYAGNYAVSTSAIDMIKLFKFAADNTKVEWGLQAEQIKGKRKYVLRTSHERENLKGYSIGSPTNLIYSLHSHPKDIGKAYASGNYEKFKKLSSTSKLNSAYWSSDLLYINNIYTYLKNNTNRQYENYPKAYIYRPGNKKSKSLFFRYDTVSKNYGNKIVNSYLDIIKYTK